MRVILSAGILFALFAPAFLGSPEFAGGPEGSSPALQTTPAPASEPGSPDDLSASNQISLPLVMSGGAQPDPAPIPPPGDTDPKVYAPYFENGIRSPETAVFWFGEVTDHSNYADVRIGYTKDELYVHVAVFDRYLWYDRTPDASEFTQWDAVSLYLDVDTGSGDRLTASDYLFVGQLSAYEGESERPKFQAAYHAGSGSWAPENIPFTTQAIWRGGGANDNAQDKGDRGWVLKYYIPFRSLGLSGAPPAGQSWRMAVVVHDSDAVNARQPDQFWPRQVDLSQPSSWGKLVFGLPGYTPPNVQPAGVTVVRDGLNGQQVADAHVGGDSTCGRGLHYWNEWGATSYPSSRHLVVQNQYDVADWPCFSKIYLTFPLDKVPAGKVILNATLTLYQFGNAGGGEWGEAPSSLIQVSTIAQDWNEGSLTWNNAPLPQENVSQAWVDWLDYQPPFPGVPRQWDLSRAVAEAYAAGQPLRIVLYSADSEYHSGKYFYSSDLDQHSQSAFPRLEINWGNP